MNEGFANFIGKDGFNWWVGQVENDGGRYWNTELNDGEGDYDSVSYTHLTLPTKA